VAWDPQQYAVHAAPRARPFTDLLARVGATGPREVLDVGCGSGELTALLARRWPAARVRGVDASAEMLAAAPADAGIEFSRGTAEDVDASGLDVLVSNAVLQWVPTHEELLVRWAGQLRRGGWLAFQVPSNFGAPSHRLLRELAARPRWAGALAGVLREEPVAPPQRYVELLAGAGMRVDAWRTEYQHVLTGPDPVLSWVRGTALRPVLDALPEEEGQEFTRAYGALLREAYPAQPWGTPFPFLRTFVVAQAPPA